MAKSKSKTLGGVDVKSLVIGLAIGVFAGLGAAQLWTTDAAKGGNKGGNNSSGSFTWSVTPNPGEYASSVSYTVTSSAGLEKFFIRYTCSQNSSVVLEGYPLHSATTSTYALPLTKNADGTTTATGTVALGPTAKWTSGAADCVIGTGSLSSNGTWQYTSQTSFSAVDN